MAKKAIQNGMSVYVLLDRTGSMAPLWDEAVSSVNTYVGELAAEGADDRVTVAVFDAYDSGMQFDILRDEVPIGEWKPVSPDEVLPRGMTPLYDALARLISRAEDAGNGKTAIVVMTDGHENASREVNREAARAAIERITRKNWQINFLGADFDGFDQCSGIGVQRDRAMNFSAGRAGVAMRSTAHLHNLYRQGMQAPAFCEEDRQAAGEEDVGGK